MSCQSLLQVRSGQVGWDTCIDFGLADLLAAAQIRQEEPRRYGHVCAVLREMTASDSVGHQACEEVRSHRTSPSAANPGAGRDCLSERMKSEWAREERSFMAVAARRFCWSPWSSSDSTSCRLSTSRSAAPWRGAVRTKARQ